MNRRDAIWLQSIKVSLTNGHLDYEDCLRIDAYYQNKIKKVVEKVYEIISGDEKNART